LAAFIKGFNCEGNTLRFTTRLIIGIGLGLIFCGYLALYSVSPEADFTETARRVFIGMGFVVVGAAATFGMLFFKK
jgi:hypothetical protein